jgi:hypothetical protein
MDDAAVEVGAVIVHGEPAAEGDAASGVGDLPGDEDEVAEAAQLQEVETLRHDGMFVFFTSQFTSHCTTLHGRGRETRKASPQQPCCCLIT